MFVQYLHPLFVRMYVTAEFHFIATVLCVPELSVVNVRFCQENENMLH